MSFFSGNGVSTMTAGFFGEFMRAALRSFKQHFVRVCLEPPKNWRWYHRYAPTVFCSQAGTTAPGDVSPQRILPKGQSPVQREREKRRAYVQLLRSPA